MRDFPRVRWLVVLLALTFIMVFIGRGFDLAATVSSLGLWASATGAALLSIAKIVTLSRSATARGRVRRFLARVL